MCTNLTGESLPFCPVEVKCKNKTFKVHTLIVTGAEVTLISERLWARLPIQWRPEALRIKGKRFSLQTADGSMLRHSGVVRLPIMICKVTQQIDCTIVADLQRDFLLGSDFLEQAKATTDFDTRVLTIGRSIIPLLTKT